MGTKGLRRQVKRKERDGGRKEGRTEGRQGHAWEKGKKEGRTAKKEQRGKDYMTQHSHIYMLVLCWLREKNMVKIQAKYFSCTRW
jgi:hypothetical protein